MAELHRANADTNQGVLVSITDSTEKSPLLSRLQYETNQLAEALERAASALRAAEFATDRRAAGVRSSVEVEADDALAAVGAARSALEDHGMELVALAAIGGYPLGRVGEALGLTETGVAVRLTQAKVLAGKVRGHRVTRRDLTRAGVLLHAFEPEVVKVDDLMRRLDFLALNPWTDGEHLNRAMISAAVMRGYLNPTPYPHGKPEEGDWRFVDHMGRIAYLVEHFEEHRDPITVEIGKDREWTLLDGNHRLAAAWWRDERSLLVNIIRR